jgi:hypothetical protein
MVSQLQIPQQSEFAEAKAVVGLRAGQLVDLHLAFAVCAGCDESEQVLAEQGAPRRCPLPVQGTASGPACRRPTLLPFLVLDAAIAHLARKTTAPYRSSRQAAL